MHTPTDQVGPLKDILVLDLSRALAGPHAAMMLGDMGARVIKIEMPNRGDDSRYWGPPFIQAGDREESTYFLSCNRNKESVQLDLKDPEDRQVLDRLIERADVLVENFRPGVMERLGLSADVLHERNPRLVLLSITGFGHDGPEAERAGYDQIAQGEAGLMSLTGAPGDPTRVGVPIGDLLAGIHGAYGVATALVERQQTGRGVIVRTSLLSALVGVHAFQGTRYTVSGEVPAATGNHHPAIAPYGTFQCADTMLQLAVGNEQQWVVFAGALGLDPKDDRFIDNRSRVENGAALRSEIEVELGRQPAAHWLQLFRAAAIPCGAVRDLAEVYDWDQTRSQGLLLSVEHPEAGTIDLPGPPIRMEHATGTSVLRETHRHPPMLGEHDTAVRVWAADSRRSEPRASDQTNDNLPVTSVPGSSGG